MEDQNCYLWNHYPVVSSPPVSCLNHYFSCDGDEVFEIGLFVLEDGNFLCISFLTEDKKNQDVGVTEYKEFDSEIDASIMFEELIGKEKENAQ